MTFVKGKIPWNKGKKGLQTAWNKNKTGLQVAWNKGKKISEETKEKIRQHSIKNPRKYWLGKERPRGELSTNWKGGKTPRNHHSLSNPEYKKWHSQVFERDNWTCQTCGLRGVYLEAHHIKSWARYVELRFDINNGVTLCKECHKLTDNYKGKNIKL